MIARSLITRVGRVAFLFKRKHSPEAPREIVVLKVGAIGDVLLSTPLLASLRKNFPYARITYVVGEWSAPALKNNPNVDRIISFPDETVWHPRIFPVLRLVRTLRSIKPDIAFILDRHYTAPLLGFIAGFRFRVGFDRSGEGFANNVNVPYGAVRHEVDYNLDLLRAIGGHATVLPIQYMVVLADQSAVQAYTSALASPLVFGMAVGGARNPGQDMPMRRWPLRHYVALVKMLLARYEHGHVVLVGSKADAHDSQIVEEAGGKRVVNVAGKTTLAQAFAIMQLCSVFITHDSGPMHMAAAVGVPVISLFGPVHPLRKAPRGTKDVFLWKPNLPGALCDDEGDFPAVDELECMSAITPEEVLSAIAARV